MRLMNLLKFRRDKYSSTGNDGIIEYIFKTLGVRNGVFVEFGAWDGIVGSNCRKLFEEGWSGVFIEADKGRFADLARNYKNTNVVCINALVGSGGSFDEIVGKHVQHIDFCSIDVDGLDLEIFETFREYMPDVVCIEGGQMLHPDHPEIPRGKAKNNIQQSLGVMAAAFAAKGYRPICSYQDTFFVKDVFYGKFDVPAKLIDLYLDGLVAHARRIPWIVKKLKANKLSNPILSEIQKRAKFQQYKYPRRKEWAKAEINRIKRVVEEIRSR